MATLQHIKMLVLQKKKIDDRIHSEEKRPLPNEGILHQLKWRRLKINDEIQRYRQFV